MRYKLALALVFLLPVVLALVTNRGSGVAAPALQLPWPGGQQHRIYGGWTYGCPAGPPFYGTHDRPTNSDHYNADYYAIDFQFVLNDDVSAVASGTVIYRDDRGDGYGNKVVIDHGGGYYSIYAHLNSFAISLGSVAQGQIVGYAGGTGGVAVHLHMHMMLDSSAYRPEPMSAISEFGYYGYSVENAGQCYTDPNDPSPPWTSTPPPTPTPTPTPSSTPAPCVTPTPPYTDGSLWREQHADPATQTYVIYGQTKYRFHSTQDFTNMGFHEEDVQCATDGSLAGITSTPYDKTVINESGQTDWWIVDCGGKFLIPTLGVLISMINNGYANPTTYSIPLGELAGISGTPKDGCPLRETTAGPNYITCEILHAKWAMSSYAQTRMGHQSEMLTLWPAGQGYSGALSGFNTLAQTGLRNCPDNDGDEWSNLSEQYMGTDPLHRCASTPTTNDEPLPDRWPKDFNDSQDVSITDISTFSSRFNKPAPGPPYAPRWDLNTDDQITILDVSMLVLGETCTP